MTAVDYIAIKHSVTPGDAPSAAELQEGELAVNTSDLKLFVKDAAGTVQELVSSSGSVHAGNTAPANPIRGEAWVDTSGTGNPILKLYSGTQWVPAMPLDGITLNDGGAGGTVQMFEADAGVF